MKILETGVAIRGTLRQVAQWLSEHPLVALISKFALAGVPLAFLLRYLITNWQALVAYDWEFDGLKACVAILCLILAFGSLPLASKQMLAVMGYNMEYRTAYWSVFVAQLAKYIPGGVWHYPGRVLALGRVGVSTVASSLSIMLEITLLLIAGLVVFVPYVVLSSTETAQWLWLSGLLILLVALVLLFPGFASTLLQRLVRWLGASQLSINFDRSRIATILLADVWFWLMAGIGFGLLLSSISTVSAGLWLLLPGVLSISWVLGLLAFVTPAGLGVREGAMVLLLAPYLPAPLPAVLALLARVWWMSGELASVAIATVSGRGKVL